MVDLKTKQAFWAEQLPFFKEKYWLPNHLEVLEFDMIGGCFEIAEGVKTELSEEDILEIYHRVNSGWAMWKKAVTFMQKKAKELAEPSQKYFSHDFNGDGFKYHDSLEEAQKEAEVNLDYYRDRVADGHHVADEGEFFELCYGVVIASAGYTVDDVVTEEHHKNDEFKKYEVGTEILSLHFDKCTSVLGAEG